MHVEHEPFVVLKTRWWVPEKGSPRFGPPWEARKLKLLGLLRGGGLGGALRLRAQATVTVGQTSRHGGHSTGSAALDLQRDALEEHALALAFAVGCFVGRGVAALTRSWAWTGGC